jgi:hypothetical protein
MAMHKKRKGMHKGSKSSRKSPPRRRPDTIESGGRSSDQEMNEHA